MRDDSSFIELKARQRAQALLDDGSSYPIAERRIKHAHGLGKQPSLLACS